MKTYTSKQKIKFLPLIIAGGIVILVALASLVYVYALGGNLFGWTATSESTTSTDSSTQTSKDPSGTDKKKNLIDNNDNTKDPINQNITLEATQKGSTVTITTKLTGYSDGECALDISSDGKSISKTAEIIYQPEFSTCAGFSVNTSELEKGTWNITLTVTSGSSSTHRELTLEVE